MELWQRFTPRARRVVLLAHTEAQRSRVQLISTEHLLMGLLRLGDGVAVEALDMAGVDLDKLRSDLEERMEVGAVEETSRELSFTPDATQVLQLAYAESTAFTRYLQQIYGNEKLDSLVQTYADGQGCLQSIEIVFGASLPELEMHWRQAMFHEDASQITWGDTFPFFIILGMAMLTPFSMMILNGGRKPKNSTSLDQK